MPGINLRRAKNLVGTDCTGVCDENGQFYIKFRVEISKREEARLTELRIACGVDSLRRDKGDGKNAKKSYAVGKVPVDRDPRNNGSLELSKYYAKE